MKEISVYFPHACLCQQGLEPPPPILLILGNLKHLLYMYFWLSSIKVCFAIQNDNDKVMYRHPLLHSVSIFHLYFFS